MRRYQCQRCQAVLVVVPREMLPRRYYAATAIALALGLYGVAGQSQPKVRAQICPWRIVGVTAERRWYTLCRWIDAAQELFAQLPRMRRERGRRAIAQRAAMALGAHAPPSLPESAPLRRAFIGAASLA